MSICIISDHIIMLRQNFIIIFSIQHIDQVKPKYEGGASAPKASPPWIRPCLIWLGFQITEQYITCDLTKEIYKVLLAVTV